MQRLAEIVDIDPTISVPVQLPEQLFDPPLIGRRRSGMWTVVRTANSGRSMDPHSASTKSVRRALGEFEHASSRQQTEGLQQRRC